MNAEFRATRIFCTQFYNTHTNDDKVVLTIRGPSPNFYFFAENDIFTEKVDISQHPSLMFWTRYECKPSKKIVTSFPICLNHIYTYITKKT